MGSSPQSSVQSTMSLRTAAIGSAMLGLVAAQEAPLLTTALEVMSRASTSSEVLSLNLTNLIILIALKVAIIVFGLVSGGGVTGRSSEEATAVTPSDLTGGMCFLLYTGGDEDKLGSWPAPPVSPPWQLTTTWPPPRCGTRCTS